MFNKFLNRAIYRIVTNRGKKAVRQLDELSMHAVSYSDELIMKIVSDNKDTEYGKKHGFAEVKTVEDYKRIVPVSEYDDYAEMVERGINNGETNLYTAYPIVNYAITSGSIGAPKYIPQSKPALSVYKKYAGNTVFATMDDYFRERTGHGYNYGQCFNTFEISRTPTKDGKFISGISGTLIYPFRRFFKYLFTSPDELIFPKDNTMDGRYLKMLFALKERDVAFMDSTFMSNLADAFNYLRDHWQMMCDDIENGTINQKINMKPETRSALLKHLKPDAKRAAELRAEFEKGFDTPIVPRIWPKMSWITSIGSSGFMCFTNIMRTYLGKDIPVDFLAYAASEALMGVTRYPEDDSYVLLPDTGFYEFVPEDAVDYSVTYGIGDLEAGRKYEILITNLSGLYRYKIKDIVEITGFHNECPKIRFAYRKSQLLNISGEKLTEQDLTEAIKRFSKEINVPITDYCVYADTDHVPGRCVMIVEPDRDMDVSKIGEYTAIMDSIMKDVSMGYNYERNAKNIDRVKLHIQQPQTHALYRDLMLHKKVSQNQVKPVRILDTPMKISFFTELIEDKEEQ